VSSKVRFGHLDFKILEMDKVPANESYGLYLSEQQEIHLCKGMTRQRHAEVLLHECLHGVVAMQGLGHILKDLEEPVVAQFSVGIATLMRDNPKLFASILAGLK
jgi:hypothetical protein